MDSLANIHNKSRVLKIEYNLLAGLYDTKYTFHEAIDLVIELKNNNYNSDEIFKLIHKRYENIGERFQQFFKKRYENMEESKGNTYRYLLSERYIFQKKNCFRNKRNRQRVTVVLQ